MKAITIHTHNGSIQRGIELYMEKDSKGELLYFIQVGRGRQAVYVPVKVKEDQLEPYKVHCLAANIDGEWVPGFTNIDGSASWLKPNPFKNNLNWDRVSTGPHVRLRISGNEAWGLIEFKPVTMIRKQKVLADATPVFSKITKNKVLAFKYATPMVPDLLILTKSSECYPATVQYRGEGARPVAQCNGDMLIIKKAAKQTLIITPYDHEHGIDYDNTMLHDYKR